MALVTIVTAAAGGHNEIGVWTDVVLVANAMMTSGNSEQE